VKRPLAIEGYYHLNFEPENCEVPTFFMDDTCMFGKFKDKDLTQPMEPPGVGTDLVTQNHAAFSILTDWDKK
jgi:hypothetical protein